jgi:hypothetical protein
VQRYYFKSALPTRTFGFPPEIERGSGLGTEMRLDIGEGSNMVRFLGLGASIALITTCVASAGPMTRMNAIHAKQFASSQNCPAYQGGTGILTDGDFSQAALPPTGSTNGIPRGMEFAPDWIVKGRTIDFAGTSGWPPTAAPYCSVDLDGTPGPGGIEHSAFASQRGEMYTVSFQLSGNGACGPTVKTMLIKAAKQFATFTWDISNATTPNMATGRPRLGASRHTA